MRAVDSSDYLIFVLKLFQQKSLQDILLYWFSANAIDFRKLLSILVITSTTWVYVNVSKL